MMPGDLLLTHYPSILAESIEAVQYLQGYADTDEWTHAGVITSKKGDLIEALETVRESNIDEYRGVKVMVCRYDPMTPADSERAYEVLKSRLGEVYPVLAIAEMAIEPKVREWLHGHGLVCSELAADAYHAALPISFFKEFRGKTPAMLARWFQMSLECSTPFQGVWPW